MALLGHNELIIISKKVNNFQVNLFENIARTLLKKGFSEHKFIDFGNMLKMQWCHGDSSNIIVIFYLLNNCFIHMYAQ